MKMILKHLPLCLAVFASFTLQAQSNNATPEKNVDQTLVESNEASRKVNGQVFVAAKKDDQPNDPYRSAVFVASVSGNVSLTLNIPLWHNIKQPYVTFENLTKGTYMRFTTFPGESTYRTVTVTLQAGDQYRLTASIQPNPSDPNDDIDEDVLATLSW
ncbi:hypothetical protein J2T02_001928 [Chitinophaga terrae (ex Kim and Jung 2007)]|uniref:hypothetical protein n=1 Tax=Chitinophaga terrae (ex Kim and Jung 2007) TaxID=408074 RepID=UPI0027893370|nr:hypothetical protein [Chitinophaga terrae (ex Kim and Jung 2007)]MDQ0106817.1 hypothetical protein [Chitinophaga terrae (ex Kim and Jung 2007)]